MRSLYFFSKITITLTFSILCQTAFAQKADQVFIDQKGVMRWTRDSSELTGFGENYTVPFAYGYRAAKRMDVDIKAAIDQDVYQFARLDFDLFRVHVWDCEISDTLGNLLDNEHLELFDYLLWKLREKGINAIITPIAYWGNGWPEKDELTPGFSTKYGKGNCLTNPDAIKAQENYLGQFINHVNRYTGVAYKNEPQILAFEVCNEPHHREGDVAVTAFVKKMTDAIKSTGCTKPVFYNISHGINYAQAYFDGGVDGGTFQWYPTGLGFQKELKGNMLPNVDHYTIPFDDVLRKNSAARIVYEFDAADMATSYMYPAMARSFRSAGMQLATHFAWDPTYTAPYNTEYNTHFMNLFYAPQKALSLMICGDIFRSIPMYTEYGSYPDNSTFGPFHVSYEDNLAEMVTDEKFIYTNNTHAKVPAPEKLQLIAGYGNSELVEYDGTGAYFFDKMGKGLWRLEILPDATVVDNLFGHNSLDRIRAVVTYNRHRMKINLPEYANGFQIESVDWRDSIIYSETKDRVAFLKPGIYLLMSPGYKQADSLVLESKKNLVLDAFPVPFPSAKDTISTYQPVIKKDTGKSKDPISLFDPGDIERLNWPWRQGSGPMFNSTGFPNAFHIKLNGLTSKDDENPNAILHGDYTIRFYFGDKIQLRKNDLNQKKEIVFNGNTISGSFPIMLTLIMKDGSAFGSSISINNTDTTYHLPLDQMMKVQAVLLPRPYPTFLPYYSKAGKSSHLELNEAESLEISIGPGIKEEEWAKMYEMVVKEVLLK